MARYQLEGGWQEENGLLAWRKCGADKTYVKLDSHRTLLYSLWSTVFLLSSRF